MRKVRGITLIELIVVLAIVAILATLAAPSFRRMIQSNSMANAVNTFMSDTRYARSEAVRLGGRVIMCRSADPDAATPSCTAGSAGDKGWVSGWIIFHDMNADNAWDAADRTLRVQPALTSVDQIVEKVDGAATVLKFTATGRLLESTLATELKFGGTQFDTALQRVVCLSAGGRTRIAGDGSTNCGTSIE